MCAIAWKEYKAGKGTGKKGPHGAEECGIVAKELMNGRVAEEMMEERKEVKKGSKGSKDLTGTVTGTKGHAHGNIRAKGKGKGKSETRHHCYDCGGQGHIGVNCPYKWTNSIDEERTKVRP